MNNTASQTTAPEGYAISYGAAKGQFRVYLCACAAAAFALVYFLRGSEIALLIALGLGAAAYHFYPLIERNKARLGAGQYGIFIDGFGIIPWRAVDDIRLSSYAIRSIIRNELHIQLSRNLPDATLADWRKVPVYRYLMMLPWTMTPDNTIHINLEPFSRSPEEILREIQRRRTMYAETRS